MKRIVVACIAGLALTIAGCGKDPGPKGETGPEGPARAAGEHIQGVAGAQGQSRDLQGPQGAPGARGAAGPTTSVVRSVQADGAVFLRPVTVVPTKEN